MVKWNKILLAGLVVLAGTVTMGGTVFAQNMNVSDFPDAGIRAALKEAQVEKKVKLKDEDGKDYEELTWVPVVDEQGDFDTEDVKMLTADKSVASLEGLDKLAQLESLSLEWFTGGFMELPNEKLMDVTVKTAGKAVRVQLPYAVTLSVMGTAEQTAVIIDAPRLAVLTLDGIFSFTCSAPANLNTLTLSGYPETELKVDGFPNLEILEVKKSRVGKITGMEGLKKLRNIMCDQTAVKSLDLRECKKLQNVEVTCSGLSDIWLPDSVERINVNGNKLTSIGVPSAVVSLCAADNRIKSLDLSKKKKLVKVDLGNNKLTSIKLPSKIKSLDVEKNDLKSIRVEQCKALSRLYVAGNKNLKKLDVSKNKKLGELSVYGTQISKLNLKKSSVKLYFHNVKKNKEINVKKYIGTGWKVVRKNGGAKYNDKNGTVKATKKGRSSVTIKKGKNKRILDLYV